MRPFLHGLLINLGPSPPWDNPGEGRLAPGMDETSCGGGGVPAGVGGPRAPPLNDVERGGSVTPTRPPLSPRFFWTTLEELVIVEPPDLLQVELQFRTWFLFRSLPAARATRLAFLQYGTLVFTAYCLLFTLAVPIFNAAELVPYFAAAYVAEAALVAYLGWQRRWSVEHLSNVAAFFIIVSATCVVLGGFTRWNPCTFPKTVVAADGTTSTVYVRSETEFENDAPSPFLLALACLSATASLNVAASGFPVTFRNAWAPFFVPAVWLAASAAYTFSATNVSTSHFLKVSLHQFALLIQIAIFGCVSVAHLERHARDHFFTVLGLRAEQLQCDRVLALLLPSTIMESLRAPVDASSLDEGIPGSAEIRGVVSAGLGDERFAERSEDASVMFAEGKEGKDMGIVNAAARSHLIKADFSCT